MTRRIFITAILLGLAAGVPASARLAQRPLPQAPLVFVQTNKLLGNTIEVFDRAEDGTLTRAGEYETGGLGGATVQTPGDSLSSQGSLVYRDGFLFAVNAGSNTLTLFRVQRNRLERLQVVPSGGLFPVSIAVRGRLVYVLNAGGEGAVQGFRFYGGKLSPIDDTAVSLCPGGAGRALGLRNTNPPLYASSPAQVGFSPDGRFLIVTTKSNDAIYTYRIFRSGRLAEMSMTSVAVDPIGFTFSPRGTLLVSEGATASVAGYRLRRDGSLTPTGPPVPNGQVASCWIQQVGRYFFVSNPGSSTISSYREDRRGRLLLVHAVAADTEGGGNIDLTVSGDYLYVQNALAGTVEGYAVGEDGSLTLVTTVTGLPALTDGHGMEGIAAS